MIQSAINPRTTLNNQGKQKIIKAISFLFNNLNIIYPIQ